MITLAQDFGFGQEFASEEELKEALRKFKPTTDAVTFARAWRAAGEAVRQEQAPEAAERFTTPADGLIVGPGPRS